MASRLRLPITIDRNFPAEHWHSLRRRYSRWRALGWKLALWRLLWLPFTFAGELPAPWLPERSNDREVPPSSAARETVRAIDSIRRRIWLNMLLAAIVRGLWLPFVAGIAIAGVQYLRDRDWSPQILLWGWAITIPLAIALTVLLRPGRWRTAWMLDHTFALRDRLTTAVEALDQPVPDGAGASMGYLQLADSANVVHGLRGDPRFRLHPPAREISLAILTGLLLMAMIFLQGVGGSIPPVSETGVPAFVPAAERRSTAAGDNAPIDPSQRPPTVAEVQARADKSNSTRDDLDALADALDDNPLTKPAADAIRNGDYTTAAQALRDIANQAGDMSPEARNDLANALDQAAASSQESSPNLSNAASSAASGLREGDQAAENGLRDLGDAVDLAGQSVVPQEQLSSEMTQAQENAANQSQGADAASAASGQQQSGQSVDSSGQQSNNASNPAGADAAPGQASNGQPQQSGQSGDQQQPGDSSSGNQAQGSQSDGSQQAGGGQQPGAASSGTGDQGNSAQAGEADGSGNAETAQGGPADGGDPNQPGANSASQQSGGSAGGESQQNGEATKPAGASNGSGQSGESNNPLPTATSVSAEPTPSGAGTQPTVAPNSSVNLGGDGGESIQLGGGGSASSLGSGAGVMVAEGTATQEAVPTAEPDSNSVPEDYRRIVEQYFSRDGS
jgi:hypothetical protein